MRLPRLRLPLPSRSLGWLGGLLGRTAVLYVGYTAVLFLVCLLLTFPHDLLIRRAVSSLNRGPVGVEFTKAGFAWHNGYEISGLRVGPADADGQAPYVELSRLWVRPLFSALVRGNPYAAFVSADLYGGNADGEVVFADGAVTSALRFNGLQLGRYRTLTALLEEGQLEGRVSGQCTFEARGANFSNGQVTGEMTLDGAGLTQGKIPNFGALDVHFKQSRMKFTVRAGRVEVQDFNATGDLNIQASGQIVLRNPVSESVLNLRATILPSPDAPANLKGALTLIPHAPGAKPDAPVTITGTVAKPRFR